MAVYYPKTSISKISEAHTINEFISMGLNSSDKNTYRDLSYYETRDGKEFVIKQILDDSLDDLLNNSIEIELTEKEIRKYKYNPKLLSYDLYGTTKLFYIIMRLNGMCNVHEFSLSSGKLKLLPSSVMSNAISSIYKEEKFSMNLYNNSHKNDTEIEEVEKYK